MVNIRGQPKEHAELIKAPMIIGTTKIMYPRNRPKMNMKSYPKRSESKSEFYANAWVS